MRMTLSDYLLLKLNQVNNMPTLEIDMFDDAPKVGDKIKVLGKVESIDEDTGEVEVTYDDAKIVKKSKKRRDNDDDDDDDVVVRESLDPEMMPQSQSVDGALNSYFQRTE